MRWTVTSGTIRNLGTLPGGALSEAYAVDADGDTVVGYSTSTEGVRAFVRTAVSGSMQNLGVLGTHESSEAYGTSANGSVVVGVSRTFGFDPATGPSVVGDAFRWTSAGMQPLSVVGTGMISGGLDRAFLWTPALGMVDLNTYLPTIGFDLNGWTLEQATAISADGTSITGFGTL